MNRELAAPVGLWDFIHQRVPVLLPVDVRQPHESRVRDEQHLSIRRCMLHVVNDVSDDPSAVLAVNGTVADSIRHQSRKILQCLVYQENGWLNEQNLLAHAGETVGVSDGCIGFGTTAGTVYIMNDQNRHSS